MNRLRVSTGIAITFFTIGSILFALQLFMRGVTAITIIGYYYLILSVIINLIVVLFFLAALFLDKNKKETLKSICVILLNIPVSSLYAYMTLNYLL